MLAIGILVSYERVNAESLRDKGLLAVFKEEYEKRFLNNSNRMDWENDGQQKSPVDLGL